MTPSRDISRLIEIMAALRTPVTGCPWDLEQDFASIAPYTIEEAYEVADAISRKDLVDLKEELGDRWLRPDLFRFGASSLLNDVVQQLHKERTGHYDGPDYVTVD